MISYPSPHFDERNCKVSKIIIHSTECNSAEEALAILTDPKNQVSCHYLISKTGDIYQLVKDENRAWHAGKSAWKDDTQINHSSIGIELDHPSPDLGPKEYPSIQIEALIHLLGKLIKTHDINPINIWAHSDIAPDRKRDPGNDFPWEILAKHGFGLWPETNNIENYPQANKEKARQFLHKIGYRLGDFNEKITAFQRHFLRHHVTQELDQRTVKRLAEVAHI